MAEFETPQFMKDALGTGGAEKPGTESKKAAEPFLIHPTPERERNLPAGTPPRPQRETTHEGLMHGPMRLPAGAPDTAEAIAPLGGSTPSVTHPRFAADDLAQESWMNKDPMTWQPQDAQERIRWKKTFNGPQQVEWNKLVKEQSYWHLATRDGRQSSYTLNNPNFLDFMKRKRDFYSRTVPRWRQLEKQNPPRHYRKRADAVEALGGETLDVG